MTSLSGNATRIFKCEIVQQPSIHYSSVQEPKPQKQPLYYKIHKIYRKTRESEFLFNKVTDHKYSLIKDLWKNLFDSVNALAINHFHQKFPTQRSSRPEVFCKKGVLRNFVKFTGNTCAKVYFWIKLQVETCNFTKNETLTQAFYSGLCKISKNTFPYRTPLVAAPKLTCLVRS